MTNLTFMMTLYGLIMHVLKNVVLFKRPVPQSCGPSFRNFSFPSFVKQVRVLTWTESNTLCVCVCVFAYTAWKARYTWMHLRGPGLRQVITKGRQDGMISPAPSAPGQMAAS